MECIRKLMYTGVKNHILSILSLIPQGHGVTVNCTQYASSIGSIGTEKSYAPSDILCAVMG